jgi:hypothetical protein
MRTNYAEPKVGMPVTWIDPCDAGANELFVQNHLMAKYGVRGLTVQSVGKYADGGYRVTLERNGEIIRNDDVNPGMPTTFHWDYFVPISKEKASAVA